MSRCVEALLLVGELRLGDLHPTAVLHRLGTSSSLWAGLLCPSIRRDTDNAGTSVSRVQNRDR
ncbi:hypothetical protein BST12_06735 [Mycobacterium angelicum]|uniref:Uncharacterized protein n=1 Tax=Mycobacterium angelicum TaxID=470074 RepID=A0A1X0A1T9_MYCAN|nr:hypothetical protein BST12_06735 [Mycobacterium angelicum]